MTSDRYIAEQAKANPFYHNYVFSKEDLKRAKIQRWQYPLLWLLPTYVQRVDDLVVKYKMWQGRYYLMGIEPIEAVEYKDNG